MNDEKWMLLKHHFLCVIFIAISFMKVNSSEIQYLFKNHKEGYNVYRIPTII